MRILDVGCGAQSRSLTGTAGVGIDIDEVSLRSALRSGAGWQLCCAMTEHLPFRNETFESISCRIALPLMNIPQALDEMTRVAKPGADLFLSVHPLKFTLQELRKTASAKAKLYRTFVIANGLFFHVTGRLLWYPSRMIWFPHGSRESFQTRSRMRKELAKRGFIAIEISLENQRFLIRARKDDPQSIHN